MSGSTDNKTRLEQAGIIKQGHVFSPQDTATLENLSPQEVDSLIQIGQKLGPDFLHRKGGGAEDSVGILF
jgi:hypothetical protein